ncbi:MAG TPA: hypothetical protein VNI01_14975 [Elusimicrobiota bacterium]|jgi:hypothetical protein|nr:hypothetical protein [Elusimicrobiota bacterium]
MKRLFLVVAAAALAACATEGREAPGLATKDCHSGELGWWHGPITRCSWYPYRDKEKRDARDLDSRWDN